MLLANLKSSLDRFIGRHKLALIDSKINLKSSLDRFIETNLFKLDKVNANLKSSLDRFIEVLDDAEREILVEFKIQFG